MQDAEPVQMIDPSQMYRPEYIHKDFEPEYRSKDTFRTYNENPHTDWQQVVKDTYSNMHKNQTLELVKQKEKEYGRLNKQELTIMEALEMLNRIIDESDPDCTVPNIYHAFQTAERIRQVHPDEDWFHLTGLIHDLGKLLAIYGEPQWSVVGDTFPVGCQHDYNAIVYGEDSFKGNPDLNDSKLSSYNGIYEECTGLQNVHMSFGHDEYLYMVLKGNKCNLPEESLYMIRYHSFYPWHSSKAYYHLCNNYDMEMLKWVKEFNKFDLYSKSDTMPDIKDLTEYYQGLIDKYCPGKLRF